MMSEALRTKKLAENQNGRKDRLRSFYLSMRPSALKFFLFKRFYTLHDLKLEQDILLRDVGALPLLDDEAMALRYKLRWVVSALFWLRRRIGALASFFAKPTKLASRVFNLIFNSFEKALRVVARPIVCRLGQLLWSFRLWWRDKQKFYPILWITVVVKKFLNPIVILLSGQRRGALKYYLRLWFKSSLRSTAEAFTLRTKCLNRSVQVFQNSNDIRKIAEIFEQLNQLIPRKKNTPLTLLITSLLPDLIKIDQQRDAVVNSRRRKRQKISSASNKFLFSVVILDTQDLQLFIKYCVPSLKAKGNLRSLSEFDIVWNVYGHINTVNELKKKCSEVFDEKKGTNFFEVSDKVRNPSLDYLKLQASSAFHQVSIKNAREIGANVFLLSPRQVFCENFILGILTLAASNKKMIFTHAPKINRWGLKYAEDFKDASGVLNLSQSMGKALISRFLSDFYSASLNTNFAEKDHNYPTAPTFLLSEKSSAKMFTSQVEALFLSHELIENTDFNGFGLIDGSLTRAFKKTFIDNDVLIAGQDDNVIQFRLEMPENQWNNPINKSRFAENVASGLKPWDFEALNRQINLDLKIPSLRPKSYIEIQSRLEHYYNSIKAIEEAFGWNFFATNHIGTPQHLNERLDSLLANQRQISTLAQNFNELIEIDAAIARLIGRLAIKFDQSSADKTLILLLRLGLDKSINTLVNEAAPNFVDKAKVDVWRYISSDPWTPNLQYFKARLSHRPKKKSLMFSYLFWGERFGKFFVDIHIPSLLARGNIPSLSKSAKILVFIVVDPLARSVVEQSSSLIKLKKYAEVSFLEIPSNIQVTLTRNQRDLNFYLLYGMMDHLGIAVAQQLNVPIALFPVDSVVSNRCLTSFWRALEDGFEVCGGGNIVANEEDFVPLIRKRHKSGVVDLSVKELSLLAQTVPHHYFNSQIVVDQNIDFGAHPRELFFNVDGFVEIRSIFVHPLMVSADSLQRYQRKHYANIDYGMIPRIVSDVSKIFLTGIETDAYINNFAEKERVFETLGRDFDPSRFALEQSNAHTIQRNLFSRTQKLPALCDFGWRTNREEEIAFVIDAMNRQSK